MKRGILVGAGVFALLTGATNGYSVFDGVTWSWVDSEVAEAPSEYASVSLVCNGETETIYGDGEFKGLYTEDGSFAGVVGDSISSGEEYYAKWEESTIVLSEVNVDGYDFLGWEYGDGILEAGSEYNFETCEILQADLEAKSYVVSFDSNESVEVSFGEFPESIDVPTLRVAVSVDGVVSYEKLDFLGYYWGDEMYFDFNGEATREWDLAQDTYLISRWSLDGLEVPEKEYYEFVGWSTNGEKSGVVGDFTYVCSELAAIFEQKSYYLILSGKKVEVLAGECVSEVSVPTKFNYMFCGYFVEVDGETYCIVDANGVGVQPWIWDYDLTAYSVWSKVQVAKSFEITVAKGDTESVTVGDAVKSIEMENGKVSATSTGRKVTVTGVKRGACRCLVKTKYYSYMITITVKKQPTKVSVSSTQVSLRVGESYQLKPYVPAKCYCAKFKYSSSKNSIASVSSNGKVFAKKKGKTAITITTGNGKACKVKIKVS